MVLGQGLVVRSRERDAQLFRGVGHALAQRLGRERKAASEPQKTLSGVLLLLVLLGQYNGLQGFRGDGVLEELIADFLRSVSSVHLQWAVASALSNSFTIIMAILVSLYSP